MRFSTALIAPILMVLAFGVRASAQNQAPFVTGEILVKFTRGAAAAAKADAHALGGGTPLAEIARTGVQLVAVAAGDESAAIARYRRSPNVLYAEPNFVRTIPEPGAHLPSSEVMPGDRHFDEQWALRNTGQAFYCLPWFGGELCFYIGTADADIDAPEAWAISTGAADVKVAVIDSGVDYTHPDLTANYAGGDDFTSPDGDPMDDHGHGTHVAGTIAAAMNNLTGSPGLAEGVVGVAPNARILAYKVCRADGRCSDFAIEQAIARAITDGAKVINMSLGGSAFSQSTYDAVQDAWNAGLTIVAAAGNNGSTALVYPAAYDNVVSVAAFDEDHRRPSFSTYGSWVDLAAPGNAIISVYPMAACLGSDVPGDTGCYTWMSGTSMAAPHVAGAAALVWSRSDVTSNSQVVDILLDTADSVGVASVRLDTWTAHGGLNVHNALSYLVSNQPPVARAGPDQTVTDSDGDGVASATLDGSGSVDPDGDIVNYEWRSGDTIVGFDATVTVWLTVGVHSVTLEVTDDDGDIGTDTTLVTVQPAAAPVDTVVLTRLAYNAGRRLLTVEATSSDAPHVTLTAFDGTNPSNPIELGALSYSSKRGRYSATFDVSSKPVSVSVVSSGGGSETGVLGAK